jgi:hypothetical protein
MPSLYSEKWECWDYLIHLKGFIHWHNNIVAGDFNTTLCQKEKRGGSIVRDPFRERMEDLISLCDLTDVKPQKGKYTWTNKWIGP